MGHRELEARRGVEPDAPVESRARASTPAELMLALQAGAGNQAVTAHLSRFYENAGYKRSQGAPRPANGPAKAEERGWKENGIPPEGRYLIQEGKGWLMWNQSQRTWEAAEAPERPQATAEEKPLALLPSPKPLRRVSPPADSGHFKGPSTTTMKLGKAVPDSLVEHVFGYLDSSTLIAMRGADKFFRQYGSSALRKHLAEKRLKPLKQGEKAALTGMSSLGTKKSLIEQYHDAIMDRPPQNIVVAADQINRQTVAQLVSGFKGAVKVHHGSGHGQGGPAQGKTTYNEVQGPWDDVPNSKMHNKALVGTKEVEGPKGPQGPTVTKGEFLVSGSPNLTKSAMDANTESAVTVRYPGIATMYKDYIERIGSRTAQDAKFSTALEGFNATNPVGIRAALAPFVNIGETLNAELQGADKVVMRMFLVGDVKDDDPIDMLCALAQNKADVTVVVDRGQAASTGYIRQTLDRMQSFGVKIHTETGKDGGGIMHDKLVLTHHPETETDPEVYKVMVGSSGITKHVINNWSYENLLIIDDEQLFDELMVHHDAAEENREGGVPAVNPSSDLGRACSLLTDLVGTRDDGWDWVSMGKVMGEIRTSGLNLKQGDVWDAVTELGMRSVVDRGRDWIGF